MAGLTQLAPGVHVWLADRPGHGATNIGVVLEADGATVIDAGCVPSASSEVATVVEGLGYRIRRCVYTTSHFAHVGGSTAFSMAARYGRALTSAHLDQPANADNLRRLFPDHAGELDEPRTRPVSHVVSEAAWISSAVVAAPTRGQQAENLVAQVPGANVVFAGAMCSVGVTPLCFDGDPAAWADALDDLCSWGTVVVPGAGPVAGHDEVRVLQDYLRACVAAAAAGQSHAPPGPWDGWAERRFDEVNVERAAIVAAGEDRVPDAMLRLLGLAD